MSSFGKQAVGATNNPVELNWQFGLSVKYALISTGRPFDTRLSRITVWGLPDIGND